MIHTTPFRLVALLVATVLTVVAATPAPAEALDALTIVAIAGLVVAGIVLVAYLVVANVEGGTSAVPGRTLWMACAGTDCAPIPATEAAALASVPVTIGDRQSP
jgi:hypothetical protein